MRRAAKVDRGHQTITVALRAVGCSVQSLAAAGSGVPDLLVGYRGVNLLLEVKAPPGPNGGCSDDGQKLGKLQQAWMDGWRGQACVVRSPHEALRIVGAIK